MHWLSKKSTKIIMIMPAVILFTVFYLAPIFISVYYSFTDFSGIGAAKFIGFKNYQVLLNDKFFFMMISKEESVEPSLMQMISISLRV